MLMFAISRLAPRPAHRADIRPRVSLIIAARNEERDIAAKLENALALDYPKDLLQIIVASDGSTDGTVDARAPDGARLERMLLPRTGNAR